MVDCFFFMPSCKFVDGVIVLLDGFFFNGVHAKCGVVDGGVFLEAYFCGPELFEMSPRFFIVSTRMPLFILCGKEALAYKNTHCDVDHLLVNDRMPQKSRIFNSGLDLLYESFKSLLEDPITLHRLFVCCSIIFVGAAVTYIEPVKSM